VDGSALNTAFARTNYFWVALAVLNSIFSVYALGWRWRILLDPKDRIPIGALFRLNILSQCANILMPARAGDFLRAYMTSTVSRASGGFALGTIVIERFFDFMAFVFFWMLMPVALAIQTRFPSTWIAALICGLALCAVWALARHPQIVARGGRAISRLLPERFGAPVQQGLSQGLEAFAAMRKPRTVFYLSAITVALTGLHAVTNLFLFRAFRLDLSFWPALFVLLAAQAGALPPSVPGRIGIFEYAVILALSAFGIAKNDALSYALMLHVVAYLPKILIGFFFFGSLRLASPARPEGPS